MDALHNARQRIFQILEAPAGADALSRRLNRGLVFLILANIAAVLLESIGTLSQRYAAAFELFERVSLCIFMLEYLLQVWVCTASPHYSGSFRGRLRYVASPLALVDLVAILPTLFTGLTADFRFLRALRVLRTLRIWKLTRYARPLQNVRSALQETADQLVAVAAILAVIVIVASGLMYVVEHPAQPDKFSSVFDSMWWTATTLTMITYDDMMPITPIGKFLGVIIGFVQHVWDWNMT